MSLWPLIAFHVCAGSVGLLSGFVTMSFRKGSRRHRLAGDVFVISMLCMSASGATVGFIKYYLTNSEGQLGNFFVGCLTFSLVATAWWAARWKDGETSIFDWAGLLVALSIGAAMVISGLEAAYGHTSLKHDLPVAPYFVFGALALLSAAGDVRMLRGEVSGTNRIVRHLWRRSVAFFIAAASFFLRQQKVMPVNIRGSKLLFVPPLLILIFLIYWLCHMRFTNTLKHKVIPGKPSTVLS